MDESELTTIIKILFNAHDGCPYCVARLLSRFLVAFPEHERRAKDMFFATFKDDEWNDAKEIWDDAMAR